MKKRDNKGENKNEVKVIENNGLLAGRDIKIKQKITQYVNDRFTEFCIEKEKEIYGESGNKDGGKKAENILGILVTEIGKRANVLWLSRECKGTDEDIAKEIVHSILIDVPSAVVELHKAMSEYELRLAKVEEELEEYKNQTQKRIERIEQERKLDQESLQKQIERIEQERKLDQESQQKQIEEIKQESKRKEELYQNIIKELRERLRKVEEAQKDPEKAVGEQIGNECEEVCRGLVLIINKQRNEQTEAPNSEEDNSIIENTPHIEQAEEPTAVVIDNPEPEPAPKDKSSRKKKIAVSVLVVCLVIAVIVLLSVFLPKFINKNTTPSNVEEVGGLVYVLDTKSDEYTIYIKDYSMESLKIEGTHNGKNVIAIGRWENFNGENKALKEITLPSTIREIKDDTFNGCGELTKITIPSGVTSIGDRAFSGCVKLAEINWSNLTSLESVGLQAFYGCESLASLQIPQSLTKIEAEAFSYCSGLETIAVLGANSKFKSDSNCLIDIDTNIVVVGCKNSVIPDEVTGIGAYAFCGRVGLNVTLSAKITSIATGAFKDCKGTINCESADKPSGWATDWASGDDLTINWDVNAYVSGNYKVRKINNQLHIAEYVGNETDVQVPEYIDNLKVVAIESKAFEGQTQLKSIEIPTSVESIGKEAFIGCSGLESMVLPFVGESKNNSTASASTLFGYIFGEKIEDRDDEGVVTSQQYGEGSETIRAYFIPTSLAKVTILGGNVYYGAFSGCEYLMEVMIKDSSAIVGKNAFLGCECLTIYCEFDKDVSNKWSSEWNPNNCPVVWDSANNEVADDGSIYYIADGVRYALNNADRTATIVRQSKNLGGDITIPSEIMYNASYDVVDIAESAFSNCVNLTSIVIPVRIPSIKKSTFDGCDKLAKVSFGTNSQITSIGNWAFSDCSSLTSIDIPSGVTIIGRAAFSYCRSLTGIEMPSSVTSIGSYAFYGCSSITSIDIPSGVTSIEDHVFSDCSSITSIDIPSSVTSISVAAFDGCSSLISIKIPSGVTIIGSGAFSGCRSLTGVYITDLASWCAIEFHNYYANPLSYAHKLYLNNKLVTELEIPSSITSIGASVFYNCSSIMSVEMSNSVTSIGRGAFYYCSSLTSIEIPSSVTSIDNDAFSGCSSLTSIEIPSSVTSIGSYAFSNCSSLTIYCEASSEPSGWAGGWNCNSCPLVWDFKNNEVAENGNIYYIANNGMRYALKDGEAIVVRQSISLNGLKEIARSITYKGNTYNVTSIDSFAFDGCSSLTSIEIPSSVTSIGSYTFSNCSSLESIEIPSSVTSIGSYAFSNCSSLTSIEIPSGVTSIGGNAFYGCISLRSIVIPSSVANIDSLVFTGCKNLTIYCEASSKPNGWSIYWNYSNYPVIWGYKGQ